MPEPPDVDGRRREALREHVEAIAPYYTESWSPESDGPGTTLLALFAGLTEDVVERLDRVPEKHRIAFYDTLGFSRRPPQSARVPLSFQVADGAGQNVVVDGGTQAVAAATDGRPEQTFQIAADGRFEATPANLGAVYSVDPAVDGIYNHWDPSEEGGLSQGEEQSFFAGRNQQRHALYIGHVDQLNVTSRAESGEDGTTIRVKLETSTSWEVLRNDLVWEYYGEPNGDGETEESWHRFTRQPAGWETLPGQIAWVSRAILSRIPPTVGPDDSSQDEVVLDLEFDGTLTETTVNGVESRWIRVSVPPYADVEEFSDLQLGTSIEVGPGPSVEQNETGGDSDESSEDDADGAQSPKTMRPDRLLYNDVPLPFAEMDDSDDSQITPLFYPLGTAPQPQDAFYIAAEEAFTKARATVRLSFSSLSGQIKTENSEPEPELSWEYWNGDGWTRIPELRDRTDRLTGIDRYVREPQKADSATFTVPDDLEKTTVSGHEGHWIRVRLVGGTYGKRTATETNSDTWETRHDVDPPTFESLTVRYVSSESSSDGNGSSGGTGGDGSSALPLEPANYLFTENNLAYSDDLVEAARQRVTPFEPLPDDEQTVYLGFDGRLHDGPITLFLAIGDRAYPNDFHSRVRWEYCADPADDEWVRLDVLDGTEGLTERGIVSLVFPGETAPCRRFGTEFHWIRARVTGDSFEPLVFPIPIDPGRFGPGWFDPGRFGPGVIDPVRFDPGELEIPPVIDPNPSWTQPDLEPGWIVPRTATVRGSSMPDWITSSTGRTAGPPLMSGIAAMTESANVAESIDAVEAASTMEMVDEIDLGGFVSAPQFPIVPQDPIVPDWIGPWLPFFPWEGTDEGDEGDEETEPVEPCGRTLETEPPSGDPTKRPPTVSDISPNTGWAYNVRTVENVTLGSSDGSQSQTFGAADPPVIDETVWVDELHALSEGKRQELSEARTPAVETKTGGDGSLQAFWVEWREVPDFLDSGEDERHYAVDRVPGRITFGDGIRGRIPPRGQDNVRISYQTGGGPDGNVDVGAVAELKSSLQFVDSVTNPAPGTGGAAAESTDGVISRASKQLRDRDRAVTEVDYERIAMDAARRLARVKCIPDMNRAGESAIGWVTLLLVPNAPRTKPVPSTGLKEQVRAAVSDRAPATVVAADRLVVRGPSYVEVSVETDVVADGRGSVATLEESVTSEVEAYLHPLSGGEDGEGWAFGELPAMSDLYALLEGIDGVDHVTKLSMRFETSEGVATIREGEEPPSVSADALIHSGTHEVTVRFGAPETMPEPEEI